jgi:hypothetical protein
MNTSKILSEPYVQMQQNSVNYCIIHILKITGVRRLVNMKIIQSENKQFLFGMVGKAGDIAKYLKTNKINK